MATERAAEEQFGPYAVYERLGVGGMATVHRALERGPEGVERMVALKRLLPHLAEDASFIKSFVREAKLASFLNHINIVRIYELGRVGTEYFISMEYIDGRDVRRILRHARKVTGPPPVHVTVGLVIQLCDALDYAHGKADDSGEPLKLVHRDVSPSNIIVTSAGHLKVIDFGIAKAESAQLRTQTGRVKGKLAYMAPEALAGGRDLDARTDLWAVGVILHELLTARPLFASKNEYQTLLKVQKGEVVPPSTFNHGCPSELDAIVLKALARDPDHRFATGGEMRTALLEVAKQHQLEIGYRDVATWLDWAFSIEQPAGFGRHPTTGDRDPADPQVHAPRPARITDEEEAIAMAWGSNEAEVTEDGPLVLDDVPDVTAKPRQADPAKDLPQPMARGTSPLPATLDAPRSQRPNGPLRATGAISVPKPTATKSEPATQRIQRPSDRQPAPRTTSPGIGAPRPAASFDPEATVQADNVFAADASHSSLDDEQTINTRNTRHQATEFELTTNPVATPLPDPALPAVPVVRFSRTTPPPMGPTGATRTTGSIAAMSGRTTGSMAAISGRPPTQPPLNALQPLRRKPTSVPPNQLQRLSQRMPVPPVVVVKGRRMWAIIAAGVVAIGGATLALVMRHRPEPTHVPAPAITTGTVKFVTEPVDADIMIEGVTPHTGSPWAIDLPAGVHGIEIRKAGFKGWVTSIELSANQTQTLRVVLAPLGAAQNTDATLAISTTPPGLDALLDGEPLPSKTPTKATIKIGPHTLSVKQDGALVWQQTFTAEASSDYEFNPSFTADKQRERAQRTAAPKPEPLPEMAETTVEPPPPPPPAPAPMKTELTPPPAVPTPKAPAMPPPPSGPVVVLPGQMQRRSGVLPEIAALRKSEVPENISTKLCIDTTGKVSSATVLSRLDRQAAGELSNALAKWVYAPYEQNGTAVPACFVLTMRVK
jgi:serine/threonine protein kinase